MITKALGALAETTGGDPRGTTPEEMRALVARQYETWKRFAKEANISID